MIELRPRPSPKRCTICHGDDDGELTLCHRCGTLVHLDCRGTGPCPTLGCVEVKSLNDQLLAHEVARIMAAHRVPENHPVRGTRTRLPLHEDPRLSFSLAQFGEQVAAGLPSFLDRWGWLVGTISFLLAMGMSAVLGSLL